MIKLYDRNEIAKDLRLEWLERYGCDNTANTTVTQWHKSRRDQAALTAQIRKLGDNPDPMTLEKLTGWSGLDRLTCDECGRKDVDSLVHIGDKPDYEARYVRLCGKCLMRAGELLEP